MSLEPILLGLLREPHSGYDLKATFEESIRHFWAANLSQIYPTLDRMEKKGWLKSSVQPSPKGPDRRIYRRTAAGRKVLREWLTGGPQTGNERFAYLAQLFLMDELQDENETLKFMRALRDGLQAWYDELATGEREWLKHAGRWPDQSTGEFHRMATLRMGIHSLRAKLAWVDETIERLEARLAAKEQEAWTR